MKKILITILFVAFTLSSNAQDVDYFSVITKGKKLKTDASMDGEARFIVEMPNKTAAELYEMVQLAISEQWVNPDEVIDGQSVKDKVWKRDGGKCVECGSNENLEFDHIIPHSKGGANTYRNIQLLCEPCNRSKSAKIG